jgi:hypothetical protein
MARFGDLTVLDLDDAIDGLDEAPVVSDDDQGAPPGRLLLAQERDDSIGVL